MPFSSSDYQIKIIAVTRSQKQADRHIPIFYCLECKVRQTEKQVGNTREIFPSFSQYLLNPATYVPGPGLDPGGKW